MQRRSSSDAGTMENEDNLTADVAANFVRDVSDTGAVPQIVVNRDDDDNSEEDKATEATSHAYREEQESPQSLPSSSRKRKLYEAWEKDADIDNIISEGTGEALPVSFQSEYPNSTTSKTQTVSKTLAGEIEAEELRRMKKRQRHERTIKAHATSSDASDLDVSDSHLNRQPSLVPMHDQSPDTARDQPPVPRDWSSNEMLGIVQPEPKATSHIRGAEKRPDLILSCRELLPPFLPQRLLPPARWGKLPPPRINIPTSDWNQDTSSIRNPSKKGLRVFKIPSRLYTNSRTVEGQLRVASWKNEIYAARNRGERHCEDFDREFWGAQIFAEEENEEDKREEPEAEVIIREVPDIIVSELAESAGPGKKRKRVVDSSKLAPPKAAPTKKKPASKNRAALEKAKLLRQARAVLKK